MEIWQEAFDYLKMKSLQTEIDEKIRFKSIYEDLNPEARTEYEKLYGSLAVTNDQEKYEALLRALNDNDYYRMVIEPLCKATSSYYMLRYRRKMTLPRN